MALITTCDECPRRIESAAHECIGCGSLLCAACWSAHVDECHVAVGVDEEPDVDEAQEWHDYDPEC